MGDGLLRAVTTARKTSFHGRRAATVNLKRGEGIHCRLQCEVRVLLKIDRC